MTQPEHLTELAEQAQDLPKLPGVYLMRDEAGETIYVGKAKDLRVRVRTYFQGGDGRAQIEFLLRKIRSLETIVTENEEQAFLLERDLIHKLKPRYNIRLKDDKAYLSVRIDRNQEWPRLQLVRKIEQDGALYFGPYTHSYELRALLDIIKRVIPLRTCTDTVLYNRQRPCLEYQIKRCAGPCCLPVDPEEYASWVDEAVALLEGRTDYLVEELRERMDAASAELRFEDAALLRDRIALLKNFKTGAQLVSHGGEHRDVFALHREGTLAILSVMHVRFGRIAENVNFPLENIQVSDEEVVEAALGQYYSSGRDVPEEIVLPLAIENEEILRKHLQEQRGSKVSFFHPRRGVRYRLLNLARLNAEQHYLTKFNAESRYQEIAKQLSETLQLNQLPRHVECIDISNFQGSDIVGAVVVFYDGNPLKSSYKRYRISAQGKPDDFGAIREVVARRLRRGLADDDLPDLIVIDGGQGQLSAALEAREDLKLSIDIVSLAKMRAAPDQRYRKGTKKPERVFLPAGGEAIPLDPAAPVTQFLQRIRDEVHRFVISFHRSRRSKRVFHSALDEISGIGPERKRRLLKEFGSVKQIAKARLEDIAKAGRMPASLAQKVQHHLRSK